MLGQGGFGITYLAKQSSLGRYVAIKEFFMKDFCLRADDTRSVSTPTTGSRQQVEQYRRKFVKETHNLARLNHPNIISIIEVFEENGTVYYSMPYLSGGSLQEYVKTKGNLSEAEAMKYIRQIANALKYMHEDMHICHYDVKPSNILLDSNGNAVLIDFGISKHYDGRGQETTTTPVGLSEGYAPIEQYQQDVDEFSPASDVYALGATLYYLLHGKQPVNAPSRAGGTALLMKNTLSPNIKNIINASMKISKAERAKSMDVFLTDNYTQTAIEDESTIIAGTATKSFSQDSEETIVFSKRNSSTHSATTSGNVNESGNNSYLGWIVGITILILIGYFMLYSNGEKESNIQPSQVESNASNIPSNEFNSTFYIEQEQQKEQQKKQETYNWSGSYSAVKDAGGTYGGTPIIFETTFTLKRVNNEKYTGTIEISGYQTYYGTAKIEGYVNGNRIRVNFVSSNDDGINKWSDICQRGTPLFSLSVTNGTIDSQWYAVLCETEVVDQGTPVTKN